MGKEFAELFLEPVDEFAAAFDPVWDPDGVIAGFGLVGVGGHREYLDRFSFQGVQAHAEVIEQIGQGGLF